MPRSFLLIPAFALLAACATTAPPPAEDGAADGLERVASQNVDTLLVARDASLANYHRLILDSVDVVFKKDWQKRHPDIGVDDVTRITSQASAAFREVFTTALSTNNGYGLTTMAGPDVLRVSASVSELEVAKAPTTSKDTPRQYTLLPGDLVLRMELRDTQSDKLLARVIDRGGGESVGNVPVKDSVANSSEARRALATWAGLLRKALDEARAAPVK